MDKIFPLQDHKNLQMLFGRHDQNLKLIEQELGVKLITEKDGLRVTGNESQVKRASELLEYLISVVEDGQYIRRRDIIYALKLADQQKEFDLRVLAKGRIDVSLKDALVTPKTRGQIEYVEAIKRYDIVFGVGPAGTGKTYLAMAMAVNAFKKGLVRRIILTRPAIEAGENLGFLPGDMVEKVLPYLRPLYDALYNMMEADRAEQYREKGLIEIAPLAYMRGRTLNDAFVILDEAQNSTPEQMKMFLTRLGFDSKAVITGDLTQSDLPEGDVNGLSHAAEVLKHIDAIKFVHLTGEDAVRHELVQKIIEAYQQNGKAK